MFRKNISIVLCLVLTTSLVAGCGRASISDSLKSNQVTAMSDTGFYGEEISYPDSENQITEEELILLNEIDPQIIDYSPPEIIEISETNSFPFLMDEISVFSTQSLKSILTFEGIRNKIKAWRQKTAIKKVEKFETFNQQNPGLAQELAIVGTLKGKAKAAKIKELKSKYPASFDKLTKKISVNRWIKFERKNPALANDLIELSQLAGEQRAARLEQLKLKYAGFFKTKVRTN